jgi:hypothetical protein
MEVPLVASCCSIVLNEDDIGRSGERLERDPSRPGLV